jgi:hypothetical protein
MKKMTAKEKAKELVDRFLPFADTWFDRLHAPIRWIPLSFEFIGWILVLVLPSFKLIKQTEKILIKQNKIKYD